MTYTALAVASVIAVLLTERFGIKSGLFRMPEFYVAYLIVLGFQLLTNGYLTGQGIVLYADWAIIGVRVVNAPIEDLLFGFSLVVLSMAVWIKLGARAAS